MAPTVPRRTGSSLDSVHRANLAALLRHVHRAAAVSRSELTALMGLNRSTIGALVGELADAGLVREEPPEVTTGAGRPSLVVHAVPEGAVVLALDVGVDHLTSAVIGLGGAVLSRAEQRRRRGDLPRRSVVRALLPLAERALAEAGTRTRLVGVGASVSGIVNAADGTVRFGPNLGWVDEPFGAALAAALGLSSPIVVGNDADLGVLAEVARGAAMGLSDVIYLAGEVGVGGGIITGGQPLRGTGGFAGEVGHMVVNPSGRRCRCGNVGCWETEIGEEALIAADDGRTGRARALRVLEAARAGDPGAVAVVRAVGGWLGVGVANLVNLLNPQMIVFGGLLSDVFQATEPQVRASLGHGLAAPREQVRLERAALGSDSSLIGAAELAFGDFLDDPLSEAPETGRRRPAREVPGGYPA